MTVVNVKIELLERHGQQMHYISDVKVENPVISVFNPKDSLHVVFKLEYLFDVPIRRVVTRLIKGFPSFVQLLRGLFVP